MEDSAGVDRLGERSKGSLPRKEASRLGICAADIMTKEPLWVTATTTLGEAARVLHEAGVRHVPVLEDGRVTGIISDRDLRSVLPPGESFVQDWEVVAERLDTSVKAVMSRPVHTVEPDRDLHDVYDLMLTQRVGAVVVVDPSSGKLMGVVNYVDVLRSLRDGFPATEAS